MAVPFIASIFYFLIFNGGILAQGMYLSAKVFILVYPLFFIKRSDPIKDAFRFNPKEMLRGLAVGLIIFAAGYVFIRMPPMWQEIQKAEPFVKIKLEAFGISAHYLIYAIIISLIHSMLEEYYWRWFVFGASKSRLVSAFAFSLHHFVVLDFYFSRWMALILTAMVAAGGLIFNFLYERKLNIWGAWSAHVLADLLIFYAGFLLLKE